MTTHAYPGRYITLHGIDGCGKSLISQKMWSYARARRKEVIVVREPGGLPQAEAVRELVKGGNYSPAAQLMLMHAARCELYEKVVVPALKLGKVVISDRGALCSVAYQGGDLGFDYVLQSVLSLPTETPIPDLTLWLDVSPKIAEERRKARGEDDDHANWNKVRSSYRRLCALGLLERVDAESTPEIVESRVVRKVQDVIDGMSESTTLPALIHHNDTLGSFNID